MIGRSEGPALVAVEDWADDDETSELVELAELEVDPEAPPAERWRVAAAAEVLLDPARPLDPLAELEAAAEWPLRLAEAEQAEQAADRAARRHAELERGALDALAPYPAAEEVDDRGGRGPGGIV
jgi:hypothetical protein